MESDLFEARLTISSDATIGPGRSIEFSARDCISLLPGFELSIGTVFETNNSGCDP